jgi:plasmid stabilization system protein ParE
LLDFPETGADRSALGQGIRVTFCRKYALYYRYSDHAVTILRVLHGAQDAAARFDDG